MRFLEDAKMILLISSFELHRVRQNDDCRRRKNVLEDNCWVVKAKNFRRKKEFRNILVPSPFLLHMRELWPRENELLRVTELVHARQRENSGFSAFWSQSPPSAPHCLPCAVCLYAQWHQKTGVERDLGLGHCGWDLCSSFTCWGLVFSFVL